MSTSVAPAAAPPRRVYPFEPYYDDQSSRGFNLLVHPPRLEWANDGRLFLGVLTPEREISLESVEHVETIWEHPRCPFVVLFTSWASYIVTREHFDAAADHRDRTGAAAPAADATTIAEAWQALPADVQATVGARMVEHARQTIPNSDLAGFATRPEVAAVLNAKTEQPAGAEGTAQHAAVGRTSEQLAAFVAVGQALSDIERRAEHRLTKEVQHWADVFVAVSETAKITIDDPRYVHGDYWVGKQTPGAQGVGFLLWLRAFADHPEALAQWATFVANLLEQGLLTDEPLPDIF